MSHENNPYTTPVAKLETVQDGSASNRARNILLSMFALIFLLSILMAILNFNLGGIVRLALTLGLMWCVLLGYVWAKWILVVFLVLASILIFVVSLGYFEQNLIAGLLTLSIGGLYVTVSTYLVRSEELEEYFKTLRNSRDL